MILFFFASELLIPLGHDVLEFLDLLNLSIIVFLELFLLLLQLDPHSMLVIFVLLLNS
jgi:hypothetical protein